MNLISRQSLLLLFCISSFLHASQKPNIILVLVDDMGYSDLGCFGGEIDTPNIDRLADEGIKFTDFTSTMIDGGSTEQQLRTKETKEADLEYLGVCLFGDTETLREFTKKFSLYK